jgi:HD-GYP domain-containing protein (c-di-GMP phosphodiesterase class II)
VRPSIDNGTVAIVDPDDEARLLAATGGREPSDGDGKHGRKAVTALADALEAKDPLTRLHALRVQRYALALTEAVAASPAD